MSLRKKQSQFAKMVSLLLHFAEFKGYEITFGETYRPDKKGHMKNSLHYIKLAIDINLFKNGKYLNKSSDHKELGLFWEFLGGSWGGRFKDGNHYSIEHNGRK